MSRSTYVNFKTRLAIYKRDSFVCAFCGKKVKRDTRILSLDHIVARNNNGSHSDKNLVCACSHCNSSKQDKSVWEFCLQKVFDFIEVDSRIRQRVSKDIKPYLELSAKYLETMPYPDAVRVI